MPIRINLLAEQQAAEEARRRDPVKRAVWAGGALVALIVLWIVSLQLRVASAKSELGRYNARLLAVEENSKESLASWAAAGQVEDRLKNLQRYSTNRFFCATALDAIQQVAMDDVRVVHLQSVHSYSTNAASTFKTNLVFPIATKKAWQFWKSVPPQTNILALVSNQLTVITGKVPALVTPVELATKIDVSTNGAQATAKIEIAKPVTATEQVLLTIMARDYADPPGRRVEEFSKALSSHPYFAARLRPGEGQGIRLKERAIQPEIDPTDPVYPSKPFVPFVIECRYRETVRANE